jgi:4-oxalocrotonate tautomerase
MPVITVDISARPKEVKSELVRRLTATAAEVTGIPPEKFIILVNEFATESIGVGGKLLSDLQKQP